MKYLKEVTKMIWRRINAHNPKLITASNALHTYMVFDLSKYRKNGFVKKVQKAKKDFQLPHLAN